MVSGTTAPELSWQSTGQARSNTGCYLHGFPEGPAPAASQPPWGNSKLAQTVAS